MLLHLLDRNFLTIDSADVASIYQRIHHNRWRAIDDNALILMATTMKKETKKQNGGVPALRLEWLVKRNGCFRHGNIVYTLSLSS